MSTKFSGTTGVTNNDGTQITGGGSVMVQCIPLVDGPARRTLGSGNSYASIGLSTDFTPIYPDSTIFFFGNIQGSSLNLISLKMFKDGVAMIPVPAPDGTHSYPAAEPPDVSSFPNNADSRFTTIPYMNFELAGGTQTRNYDLQATGNIAGEYINNRTGNDMASFSYLFIMEFANK